jgi:predicted HTH domain antitoxin
MTMLHLQLPDTVFATFRKTPQELSQDLLLAGVAKWYELGLISQGKGAELTGLSREEFMLALSRLQVSPFQYTEADLAEELHHMTRLSSFLG